jgi:hypothetical protein
LTRRQCCQSRTSAFAVVPEWVIDAEISDGAFRLYSLRQVILPVTDATCRVDIEFMEMRDEKVGSG